MVASSEVRYFDPRDPTHPLKYFGAQNFRGQICDCEQGNPDNCGFHYPNGHPDPPPCGNCERYGFPCANCAKKILNCKICDGETHGYPCDKCGVALCRVCNNDTDFPCLQCSKRLKWPF